MSKNNKLKIKCKGSAMRKLDDLKILQGNLKDLTKENYEKLRRRIEEFGFDAPFFVFENNILDGTQRYRVLNKMREDGWQIDEVPVVEILAVDLNDAKRRLLGYVSQYGDINDDGFYEFLSGVESPSFETLDFPDFDMKGFAQSYGAEAEDGEEPPVIDDKPFLVTCPECGKEFNAKGAQE